MKTDSLNTGNDLVKKIANVKATLEYWENSTGLVGSAISIHYEILITNNIHYPDGYMDRNSRGVSASPETFFVVKALNCDYWRRELERLQKEFDEL